MKHRAKQQPHVYLSTVGHAITASSFSAGIEPETLEAEVVQDADRLDALGAIRVARWLMLGGRMQRPLSHPSEPVLTTRILSDSANVLDHFYGKLLRLAETMQTQAGREEAERRTQFVCSFLDQLQREIS